MTLSIFATQASPAAVGPADSSPEAGAEPSQSFSTVLHQEGQQDGASLADAVNSGPDTREEAVGVTDETAAVNEEAVATLVSVLLGALPSTPESLPDETSVDAEAAGALAGDVGDDGQWLSPALFALASGASANSASTDGDTVASQPCAAVTESALLPPAGKALPAWSMLLTGAVGKADPNITASPSANEPAALPLETSASAALAGSPDNKTFQTLLRSEPMLASLTTGVAYGLDNASGSAAGSPLDAGLPTLIDTARLGASNTAMPANQASAELVPGLPLRSPAFGTLLANQVLWQAKVGNNEAAIRLDPPELGPIDVRISQVDNETHLHFTAGHGLTRDQLEQAIPRLRELFSQGGLSLGQVLVEQGSRDNASQRENGDGNQNSAKSRSTATEAAPTTVRLLNGLIDDYA